MSTLHSSRDDAEPVLDHRLRAAAHTAPDASSRRRTPRRRGAGTARARRRRSSSRSRAASPRPTCRARATPRAALPRAGAPRPVPRAIGGGHAVSADVATGVSVGADASASARPSATIAVATVVHAAGIEGLVTLADTDRSTFDALVATNLGGPFFLTQALLPALERRLGRLRRQRCGRPRTRPSRGVRRDEGRRCSG